MTAVVFLPYTTTFIHNQVINLSLYHRNKMIAACKLEEKQRSVFFLVNHPRNHSCLIPTLQAKASKPHSLFFISLKQLTHRNTESEHISSSHHQSPERAGILTQTSFFVTLLMVCVSVC